MFSETDHYRDVLHRNCRPASLALAAALRLKAGLDPAGGDFGGGQDAPDPVLLFHVARLNKVALVLDVLGRWPGAEAIAGRLDVTRLRTLAMNRRGLALSRQVAQAFSDAGIDYLVLKGPLQQQALFGDVAVKPSGDFDFYVDRADLPAARRLLEEQGFAGEGAHLSFWWTHGLGEQHFRNAAGQVIDLHHRLQQPGGVRPRDESRMLAGRGHFLLEGFSYPVPAPFDAICLAAVSVTKASYGREPCGGYLLDLARMVRDLDAAAVARLFDHARAQKLAETLSFALLSASAVLGPLPAPVEAALPETATPKRETLRDMALIPWTSDLQWPRRRQFLWQLCGRRPGRYLRESSWAMRSELLRRLLTGMGRAGPFLRRVGRRGGAGS